MVLHQIIRVLEPVWERKLKEVSWWRQRAKSSQLAKTTIFDIWDTFPFGFKQSSPIFWKKNYSSESDGGKKDQNGPSDQKVFFSLWNF